MVLATSLFVDAGQGGLLAIATAADASTRLRRIIVSMTYQGTDILTGADVFGADGEKVGSVAAVYPGYIVVEKGIFFPTDYYIPVNAISSYDAGQVYLNVAKDAALHSGWDTQPVDLEAAAYAPTDTAFAAGAVGTDVTRTTGEGEIHIPVMEEELTATVRKQDAGAVRIEKDVVTEERVLDVPVTEERVRVERRVVDRPVNAADAEAFTDTVIEVPVESEVVDVHKQARVAEEVVISKEAVERTERVADTVRREEVFVDENVVADPTLAEKADRAANRGI
jgi:uncharacterized protein (TIGR02271 family)